MMNSCKKHPEAGLVPGAPDAMLSPIVMVTYSKQSIKVDAGSCMQCRPANRDVDQVVVMEAVALCSPKNLIGRLSRVGSLQRRWFRMPAYSATCAHKNTEPGKQTAAQLCMTMRVHTGNIFSRRDQRIIHSYIGAQDNMKMRHHV